MLNLLFTTIYTGIGGGESLTLNLMAALDRAQFAPHLLTPGGGKFPEAAAALGVTTHTLPYRGTSTFFIPALWARTPLVGKFRAFLRDQSIGAVISDYHTLPFIVPAARSLNIPVLWNAMGWWFPIHAWQRGFFRRLNMVAISGAVRDKLLGTPPQSRPKLPPARMPVIIPGVDPVKHAPAAVSGDPVRTHLGIGPEVPLVAMIARFQNVKGHEYFLQAAKIVKEAIPAARFAVAGENVFAVSKDEAYKQGILAMHRDDPVLREAVTYLGFWPDSREVIAAADVMVCSSWFESLSMVALESMAMAKPIVSTRVGGPSETVADGETGFLVPPKDPMAFAEKIIALLRDPALRERMGSAGRARVLEHFTAARYAERIGALIAVRTR
jgi:glycosyltransferase involved in cell wall biosynthesis